MVIIYINSVELEYIMIHSKFHDHMTNSSAGGDFEGFYHIWAHDGHLVHVTWTIFPLPKEAPHEIWC